MSKVLQKSANRFQKKARRHKGILDPANAATRFQLSRYLPSADLAPFVEHHWTIHWDLRGQPPYISEVLPHSSVNFAFTVDRAWITGVTTGIYQYEVKDVGTIVGTMFKPGGFHPFWRQPIVMLTDKVVDVKEVFPEVDEEFRHALLGLNDDELMVAWVEELLLARKPALDQNMALINSILETVAADKDLRTVEMVTERFYVSGRTIQYLFQKYVGVGLKWVLMRYRLLEAVELAAQLQEPNWASVAADLGYSHQSHFVNDFKKLVGKSPLQYTQTIRTGEGK
ncbi:helix-turn-helix transcriptional regulator [Candidatus Villigracilis affinis]|uniref:helix-turn-helix transcriptional regulator n=1 Tax=Candidatus Villigracilis affinis TaxID=3140682 RepID=UPI001DA8B303|nr:helix-turn-helix transcriptional regulator [Anaerolineales bacterium]